MAARSAAPAAPEVDPWDPDEATGRPGRRWRWPVLVVVGWVALLIAALAWPVDGVHADRSERTEPRYLLPGIQPGGWVEQTVVAREAGLSSVSVRFGTFARELTCTLDTTLIDDRGEPVAIGVLPCAELVDAGLTTAIRTAPLPDSAGRTYRLRIAMRAVPGPDGVTYYGDEPTDGQSPATFSDPVSTPYALEVHTAYGSATPALAQLGRVFDRVDQYGPPWHAPVAVVALVVACIALLAAATAAPRTTAVVLVVAFALTKGVLWAVVVPPFKGPDEPAHFAYAQFLSEQHAIPTTTEREPGVGSYSQELYRSLDVFGQSTDSLLLPPGDRPDFGPEANDMLRRLADASEASHRATGRGPAGEQAPTFYLVPAVLDHLSPGTIDVRLGVARLWSVVLGAVAVAATIALGRRLFPGRDGAALLLGVAVALQPMFSQQMAVLTNDAPLIAMGAICTWIAVALTDPARARWWAPAAGLAFGFALLAKPRAVAFAPVLGIAWLIGRARGARAGSWRWEVLTGAAGVAGTYGLWWVYTRVARLDTLIGDRPVGDHSLGSFVQAMTDGWFANSRTLWVEHLWGNFGWLSYPLPGPVLAVVFVALAVGVVLVAGWLVTSIGDARRARRGEGPWMRPEGAALAASTAVCTLVVAFTGAMLYALMFNKFRSTGAFDLIQGRYALPALPAMLALPVLALRRLAPRLAPEVPLAVVAGAMAVLNVIGLVVVINGAYL